MDTTTMMVTNMAQTNPIHLAKTAKETKEMKTAKETEVLMMRPLTTSLALIKEPHVRKRKMVLLIVRTTPRLPIA